MSIIEAVGVTKSFANGTMHVDAVRGIDLTVEPGEMLAIVGPSGSGKSTLMNLLGAIETPTTGRVLFEGVDIATYDDNQRTLLRRQRIGFIFQAFNLLPTLTAVENVALPLELDGVSEAEARERSMACLDLVDVADRADHLPSMMSGGEQQRVAVARAPVIEPALVLGDEPTGNLDSVNSAQVMRLLRDLTDTRGQTVVIVTHDNDIAAQADRTVRVRDGHLEELSFGVGAHEPHLSRPLRSCSELEMMLYLRFAWRELRQRPSRPILTLMSVVIGVGAIVAVTIASGTAHRAFDQIFKAVAGQASFQISTAVGTTFDQRVVPKVREVPGVKAVAPMLAMSTKLRLPKDGQKEKIFTISAFGVDPAVDREVHDYEIVEGKQLPTSSSEESGVLLEANFAKSQGIKVGDKVIFGSRVEPFVDTNVIGLYSSKDIATSGAGSPMYLPLAAVQEFWHYRGLINSAQVKTDPNANPKEIENAIAALLPKGVSVEPPPTRSSMADEMALSTEQGMRMARGFSLLVAVFIIANTFLINVTQRRRQIGIMRAIGATRSQIAGMMYREALIMGVLGTILGSLFGIAAAHYLSIAMGTLYQSELPRIELHAYPFLIGAACGLGISLIAAILPARKASHLSPLEAMRDVLPEEIEGVQWWLTGSAVGIALLCVLVIVACILGDLDMQFTVWGTVGLLASFVLLMPFALKFLSAIVMFFLRRILPVEGKLSRLQLLRHRSRTALTVGVVFIAAACGVGLANSIMDTVNNVQSWYHKAIVADFFVRASEPSMATGLAVDLPDGIGDELKKVTGIKSLDATRTGTIKLLGQTATLIARDHTEPGVPELQYVKGDPETMRESFKNGAVAIGAVFASRTKLKVGDQLKLETDKGEKSFPIAAIVNDYQSGGLTIHMERAVARLELGYEGVTGYIIKAEHGQLADVRKQLEEIVSKNGLLLETSADIRARVDRMMSGVVASLWAMVVLLLMVSAVGVTNTLTINVLEQTRELGLLRIVAMTQAQVRKTVFAQAVIMALLALVPGIIAGVSVAYIINVAMMPVIGRPVQFIFHPALLLGAFAAGLAVVAFAALFPADRAARLDLLEAVRTL